MGETLLNNGEIVKFVPVVVHGKAQEKTSQHATFPASILHKSTSGRHRPVSYPDGPMTARYRFT